MKNIKVCFIGLALMLLGVSGIKAQQNTTRSVLSENTWFRLSIAHEGIYKIDYNAFQAMGIDAEALNPNHIRLFGNPSGALAEKNSEPRPDDLTELAIYVSGNGDGSFDTDDYVLFYGQEPTRWNLETKGSNYQYVRDRNYYSDTTYYYLCVDSGANGLRVEEQASLPVEGTTTVITEFPDFWCHEEELFSPYSFGRNWFGESMSAPDAEMTLPVEFRNLVKSKSLTVRMAVVGRSKGDTMRYSMSIGNNLLADNVRISAYGNYNYGVLSTIEKQFFLENDIATFSLRQGAGPVGAMLYLDYVEIYGWRQLKRVGSSFPFRLFPSQFGDDVTAIWVQDVSDRFWLWDVSSPLVPKQQQGVLSSGNFVFAVMGPAERRYLMFDPSEALEVPSWTQVANQNLHSITEADMLIISSPLFMQQAQQLADFHEENDGIKSVVVNVEEIYNEFSTGICDPSGIRDFIRMVYLRSGGALKYVTLFGRPSFDYRNLKGLGKNFVPCYEDNSNPLREESYGTDDFFCMMDIDEGGNAVGRMDVGIGRLPVSTMAEADAVLNKIRLYYDMEATKGTWKTQFQFLSDDESRDYVNQSEIYYNMIDTITPALHTQKIYCGAYPVHNTSTGAEIPQANSELMQSLNDGVFVLCYTGHGGVKGLTGDNVFTVSDIAALANHERMPFVFTATCEFAKYDNPLLVSAGEQLFLKPDGGAIALFSPCRPTLGSNNRKIGVALMNLLTRRDRSGKLLRLGDVVRMAKNYDGNYPDGVFRNINVSFVFFGDPALRLSYPEEDIVALKINGIPTGNEIVALGAMSTVALEGEIRKANGGIDSHFNGELRAKLYDKKDPIKLTFKNVDGTTENREYYHYKSVIYEGRVSVKNGKFRLLFQVPKDINPDYGAPRFQFYAYDSIRKKEAIGRFDNLILGGIDPAAVSDNEGPQVKFYWNTPDFVNGASVERSGVLFADLYDAQGIYHYDFSLGRNIMLGSNWPALNNMVLNDHFEPTIDDFRRGRITLPIDNLEPGSYEFKLKVWDTQDNATEATLWFVVDDALFLSQVHNFPNPFSDETWFHFAHSGDDGDFHVDLEVFDMLGRQVAQMTQNVSMDNGMTTPIHWNANDMEGKPLRSGIYLYRFTFTDGNGHTRSVSQKMVVMR